jgi:hypothetical protein
VLAPEHHPSLEVPNECPGHYVARTTRIFPINLLFILLRQFSDLDPSNAPTYQDLLGPIFFNRVLHSSVFPPWLQHTHVLSLFIRAPLPRGRVLSVGSEGFAPSFKSSLFSKAFSNALADAPIRVESSDVPHHRDTTNETTFGGRYLT